MKRFNLRIPKRYIPYLKNKYFITFFCALVWLTFFDRNDFFNTWRYYKKLQSLRGEKAYYDAEIKKYSEDLKYLMDDQANMEKYAREKYLMKRDNEDVYVIVDERVKK